MKLEHRNIDSVLVLLHEGDLVVLLLKNMLLKNNFPIRFFSKYTLFIYIELT